MQRSEIKDAFDESVVPWSKSLLLYFKQSCMKTTVNKKIEL